MSQERFSDELNKVVVNESEVVQRSITLGLKPFFFQEQEMSVFAALNATPEKFRVITISNNLAEHVEGQQPLVLNWPIHPNELASIYEYEIINEGEDDYVYSQDRKNLPEKVKHYRRKLDKDGNPVINLNCPLLVALAKMQDKGKLPYEIKIIADPFPQANVEGRRGERVRDLAGQTDGRKTISTVDANRVAKPNLSLEEIRLSHIADWRDEEDINALVTASDKDTLEGIGLDLLARQANKENHLATLASVNRRASALVDLFAKKFPNSLGLDFHTDVKPELRLGMAGAFAEANPGSIFAYQYFEKAMGTEEADLTFPKIEALNNNFMEAIHNHFGRERSQAFFGQSDYLQIQDPPMPIETTAFSDGLIYSWNPATGSVEGAITQRTNEFYATVEIPGFLTDQEIAEWIEIYTQTFITPFLAMKNEAENPPEGRKPHQYQQPLWS